MNRRDFLHAATAAGAASALTGL
ncbi:MAG: twin-arginine translocation signal domain-containing protein, partial [Gemmataceae bacterium]